MYSHHTQPPRKKFGPRRPGSYRKPGTPTTPTALGRQRQLTRAAVVRKARRMSSDISKTGSGANPFHQASLRLQHTSQNSATTSSIATHGQNVIQTGNTSNPFLAQLARTEKTASSMVPTSFGERFTKPPPIQQQVPSYAAMVTGKVPVPSFITQGPGSIPLGMQEEGFTQVPVPASTGHTHQLTHHAHPPPSDDLPKALHLKNVPEHVNNPPTLREHFSKFGEITILNCQPAKRFATVGFSTREAAVKAKRSGRLISEEPIQIFWHSGPQLKPRPEPQVPVSHSRDPRLVSSGMEQKQTQPKLPPYVGKSLPLSDFPSGQTRFVTDHPINEQGQADQEEIKSSTILRKRPAVIAVPAKRRLESKGLKVTLPGGVGGDSKQSVWQRLGEKESEKEGKSLDPLASTKGALKMKQLADDDEWTPRGRGEEEEEEELEGVAERKECVLPERVVSHQGAEEMDTIARSAAHQYYLRSLHKSDASGSVRGPKAVLQIPAQQSDDSGSVSKVTGKPRPPVKAGTYSRSYAPRPTPILPPTPMPRGQSAADLFQSLDARDEEMRKSRKNMVKQTSLTSARVVVGTCPDMCPEKERYMREDRRRLSIFEVDSRPSESGVPRVDHQRAVKEYNRSAADKAEDLPHELRPESVLLMTMDYLLTCVMDEGEGREEMWYDFVWNRTRAIRKDITLQHLCSEGCVELLEKCARFHILCAYLLCEQDITVFDQKMNNENLTKCLITLKQFYRDLRTEQNIVCVSEAEFCCYDILLHLHDGNVLNIVEQYSGDVRQTSSVRLAVDIALAYSSNNYAKFFKLVRSTECSFLSACITHCYFIEMRTKALHVMIRAYTLSKPTNYPLARFTNILAFESEALASEFCVHFDLSLTKKMIKLNRDYTHNPSSPLPARFSPSLVSVKRVNCSLGEVVNGGPLPVPPTLPRPYDSFAPGTPLAPPTPVQHSPPQPMYTDQELEMAIELVLEEVTNEQMPSVAMETLRDEHDNAVKQASMCGFCEHVMSECVMEQCADVAMATLSDAQWEWQLQEKARMLEAIGKIVAMEIESAVIVEQLSRITLQVFRESHEELVSVVTSMCDDVMCDVVRSESWEVGDEMVREAEARRKEKLEELEKQVLRKRQRQYWIRWRQAFKTRQHALECVSAIPSLPPLLPLSAQLSSGQSLGETMIDRGLLVPNSAQVTELLDTRRCDLNEKRRRHLAPLNVPSLLHDPLLVTRPPSLPPLSHSHHTTHHLYWSLVILHDTDSAHSHVEDVKILEYLQQKLKFCPPTAERSGDPLPLSKGSGVPESEGVHKISVSTTPLLEGTRGEKLKVAVKSVDIKRFDRKILTGVCAVMFLAPTPRSHQTPHGYGEDVVQSLVSVMGNGWWAETRVPMLVLAPFHVEEKFLAHWNVLRIAFQNLSHQPAASFSDITFAALQTDAQGCYQDDEVYKGLKWLAEHTPSQPPISCISVRDYIEEGVQQHFIPLVIRDAEIRKKNGLGPQPPHKFISLYNNLIAHLAVTATSHTLGEISWPVFEFAPHQFSASLSSHAFNNEGLPALEWNEDTYLDELQECIMKYRLVHMEAPPTANEWAGHYRHCLHYLEEYRGSSHQLLMPRVKALLQNYSSHVTFDQSDCPFPWDHVIITCIDHMVSTAPTDVWVSCFHGNSRDFAIPSSWRLAEASTSLECVRSMTFEPCSPQAKRHRRHLSDSYLFDPHTLTPPLLTTLPHVTRLPLATTLSEKIGTERQLSMDFEKHLKKVLSEVECSTPLPLLPSPTPHTDHTPSPSKWAGSLELGVKLLKMKIRTSRFQEKMDAYHMRQLSNPHN